MLKEVDLKTNKRSKLKNLLILIARILAIVALVIAFAQPYLPNKNEIIIPGAKSVSVYIDNSFSMEAESVDGNLLFLAKEKAIQIANSFKPTDEFLLLTNDFEGKHQRFVSREEFINLVEEIQVSSQTKEISKVLEKQKDLLKTNGGVNNSIYWLSDFQKESTDIENVSLDSTEVINLIQLEPNTRDNIYIDSIWFNSPVRKINQEEELYVKIVNQSNENLQVRVELSINKQVKSFNNVLVEANSFNQAVLSFKERDEGVKNGKISIGEYPNPAISYDDDFYFGYNLKKEAKILAINNSNHFSDTSKGNLNQLFNTDQFFKITNVSFGNVNYAELNKYNLIILHNVNQISSGLQIELLKYVEAGGSLVVFPGKSIDIAAYNELLLSLNIGRISGLDTTNTKVTTLNYQHDLFSGVFQETPHNIDLPTVYKHYKYQLSSRTKVEKLMSMRNGSPFLAKYGVGKGQAYFFPVTLDRSFSNLQNHSIFVATMLRIAENSGFQKEISYVISDKPISLKDENYQLENLKIKDVDSKFEFIPEGQRVRGDIQLFFNDQVKNSGNYLIDYKGRQLSAFGLNYDRKESDLTCFSNQEIINILGEQNIVFNRVSNKVEASVDLDDSVSSKLWKWFILLSLLFLLIEIALIRFLK